MRTTNLNIIYFHKEVGEFTQHIKQTFHPSVYHQHSKSLSEHISIVTLKSNKGDVTQK